jgi:hypothetical protein
MYKSLLICLLLLPLFGCNQTELVRIDYEGNAAGMITESDQLNEVADLFESIEWTTSDFKATKPYDIQATLFYLENPNMPERLKAYQIWFYEKEAQVVGEKAGYGVLDEKQAERLRQLLK